MKCDRKIYDELHVDSSSHHNTSYFLTNLGDPLMVTNKKITSPGSGRHSSHLSPIYKETQSLFANKYVSCGTSMGHLLHEENISVTPTADKEKEIYECGWANETLMISLFYCQSTCNLEQKKYASYDKCKKEYRPYPRIEFYTPCLILYHADEIRKLIPEKGKFNACKKDSTCEVPGPPDMYIGEYEIKHRSFLPKPALYIIGKCSMAQPKHQRDYFNNISLPSFEEKIGDTLFLPEAALGVSRMDTGVNLVGLKLMQYLLV